MRPKQTHCKQGHLLSGKNVYTRPDGKGRHCRPCDIKRSAKRVQEKRRADAAFRAKDSAWGEKSKRKKRQARYAWLNKLKLSRGCDRCGYAKCAAALDFHHYEDNKVGNIGRLIRFNKMKTVEDEIAKCRLLCSNCHREQRHC